MIHADINDACIEFAHLGDEELIRAALADVETNPLAAALADRLDAALAAMRADA